jgi:type I restriction-modification system DNA methylase subunit
MQPNAGIINPLERISNATGHGLDETFRTFLTLSFCTLSVGQREAMYLAEAKRWKKEHLSIFAETFHALYSEMEHHPYQDLLGDIHMHLMSPKSKQYSGEYYTPQNICLMMAKLILGEAPHENVTKIHEPACGSGRMILAVAEVFANDFKRPPTQLRVQAWDTSRTAVMMTFINTTLWGIPCHVFHGDTLRLKVHAEYSNFHTLLYPFPREEANHEQQNDPKPDSAKVITLGKGHEQLNLFDLDKAA